MRVAIPSSLARPCSEPQSCKVLKSSNLSVLLLVNLFYCTTFGQIGCQLLPLLTSMLRCVFHYTNPTIKSLDHMCALYTQTVEKRAGQNGNELLHCDIYYVLLVGNEDWWMDLWLHFDPSTVRSFGPWLCNEDQRIILLLFPLTDSSYITVTPHILLLPLIYWDISPHILNVQALH